jgi:glycosyltransferase involved in cell wall biosynthesis
MLKKKILYTISNFDTAGSGKVLHDLANGIDKSNFDICIACKNTNGIFFEEIEKLNLPIYIVEFNKKQKPYYNLLFRIKPFVKFLKENKIHIIHSWDWSSNWTEVLAARIAGVKYIYTKKAMTWNNHWKIKSFLSNFIITINDEMKSYFPNKKAQKLIPLGLNLDYYKPTSTKKEENIFKIITVANLVPVKGIEVIIEALDFLQNSKIKLEILGDDRSEYANYLKNIVKNKNLNNQISFLGKHNDVRQFIENSDLYIIPTIAQGEGMPMALVEAMSMGIPVLGSNVSGIKYVLKDFKEYLFTAKDSKELANKINEMYHKTNLERIEIGKTMRNYCIDNFSYQQFIFEHEKLYASLLK